MIMYLSHINHFLLTWSKAMFTFAITFCIYDIFFTFMLFIFSPTTYIPILNQIYLTFVNFIILKSNLFNLCKFHNNDDSISLLCDICNFSWGLFKLSLLAKIHNKIFQGTFQLKWCLTSQSITSTGGHCSLSKLPSPGWNLHFIC